MGDCADLKKSRQMSSKMTQYVDLLLPCCSSYFFTCRRPHLLLIGISAQVVDALLTLVASRAELHDVEANECFDQNLVAVSLQGESAKIQTSLAILLRCTWPVFGRQGCKRNCYWDQEGSTFRQGIDAGMCRALPPGRWCKERCSRGRARARIWWSSQRPACHCVCQSRWRWHRCPTGSASAAAAPPSLRPQMLSQPAQACRLECLNI